MWRILSDAVEFNKTLKAELGALVYSVIIPFDAKMNK